MSDQTLAMPEPFLTNLLAGSGWKVVEATERLRVWAHPSVEGEEILQGINVSEPEGRRLTRNALAALERTTGLARPMRPGKVKPRDKKLIQLVRQRLYGPVAPQLPAGVAAAEPPSYAPGNPLSETVNGSAWSPSYDPTLKCSTATCRGVTPPTSWPPTFWLDAPTRASTNG
mgnify:CR=1 FL=1